MKPTVSVMVPVHNGKRTICATLDSLTQQDHPNYEIIVVNNDSTDATESLLTAFAKAHSNITIVFEPRRSRGAARAAGVAAARGAVVAMIDADCIAPSHWLKTIAQPIQEKGERIVQGTWYDHTQNYWTKHLQHADEAFLERMADGAYIHHFSSRNCAMDISVARTVSFDAALVAAEDLDFYVRTRPTRIYFLRTCAVGVRHDASLSQVIRTSFSRGVWWTRVYRKHKALPDIKTIPHFESMRLPNMLVAIPGMCLYFFRKPFGYALYTIVTEIPWRIGVLWCLLRG